MSAATKSLNISYVEYLQDLISMTRGNREADIEKAALFSFDLTG